MHPNPALPKPVDAPLLIDDPEHGYRDERSPGVHLLEVYADGEGKTTAERVEGGWKIADWELTEELDGVLAGSRYWFCRSLHTVPDAHVDKLAAIKAADPLPQPSPAEGGAVAVMQRAIDISDAHMARGESRALSIVTLRMDDAESVLSALRKTAPCEITPAADTAVSAANPAPAAEPEPEVWLNVCPVNHDRRATCPRCHDSRPAGAVHGQPVRAARGG
jgi:hypothetical protein